MGVGIIALAQGITDTDFIILAPHAFAVLTTEEIKCTVLD
jgi:hypothetical protein